MAHFFSIGQLAQLADCKVPTIRWYEKEGLLAAAQRSAGNQRRYTEQHLMMLRFIRHARALGFDLAAVRQLQQLSSCCVADHQLADQIAREHRQAVREKIQRLQALEAELTRMVESCRYEQQHQCQVLEVLADHTLCTGEHA